MLFLVPPANQTQQFMNTPAHLMLNLGLLGRNKPRSQQVAVLAGAILPDVPLFVFYFWEKVWRALPEPVIWEQYFDARWQIVFDLVSFPVKRTVRK